MTRRLPWSLARPAADILERARNQMLARWPTVVRVTRFTDDDAVQVGTSLDYEMASSLVYEGRARIAINTVTSEVYEEEDQQHFTGQLVLPYSVQGNLVKPLVEDTLLVLSTPDEAMVGLTAQIIGLDLAGHLSVVRSCQISGTARSHVWTDVTPDPVEDTQDAP